MTNHRSRVEPSGGSTVLARWRAEHGPEARHLAGATARGGQWHAGPSGALQRLSAGGTSRSLRTYMAASNDRLVADLSAIAGVMSGNAELRMSLRTMRQRSRSLFVNNEYVKRFGQLLRNNVTGPRGFELQMKIKKARGGKLDVDANSTIEAEYARFSKRGTFSACGQYSRAAFERAIITGLPRDGEVIIEKLYGRQFGKHGIAWRLIDPDLLDENLNVGRNQAVAGVGKLAEGNDVRMGVERNPYGRPVAYWFYSAHPGDDVVNVPVFRHRRVEADRILHVFLNEEQRPDTVRGVPWLYAGARRMGMLEGFLEAALVNARQGASKMGWFKPPGVEGLPINPTNADGTPVADGADAEGNLITEAEPGTFGVLPAGWDFQTYDPKYPDEATDPFAKLMLRAFAASVGISYNTLAQDLEGVSLSAMRHGANNDRDTYEGLQEFFRENVGVPMFEPWLDLGLSIGAIGRLPPDAFERLNCPLFIAKPFRSPDPQKDVAAYAQEVALGINSRTRIAASLGRDIDEVMDELAAEESAAREKGVTLNTQAAIAHKTPAIDDAGKPAKPGAEAETEPDDDDETPPKGDDDESAAK